MKKRISDIKDRDLEMIQMKEERDLRVKTIKELYKNYLTPTGKTKQNNIKVMGIREEKRKRRKQRANSNK